MSNDDSEIALTPDELNSICSAFPPSQLPLLCSFRSSIRYDKQSRPNSAVALSSHYIGLFSKSNQESNFFTEKKIVHIDEIENIYYSTKPFAVFETKKTKISVTSKQSLHLAQLLYVITKISYSYYPKQVELISEDENFPTICFLPGKRDLFSPFISYPQQFQFTYYAECSSCGVPYNHDVVRYINSMMLSANSIIDITQLPLDFSETNSKKTNKQNSEPKNEKDDKRDDTKDDKKSKSKDKKSKEKKKEKEKKKNDKKKKEKEKKKKDSKSDSKSDISQKQTEEVDQAESDSSDIYENFDFSQIENRDLIPIFKSLRYLEFANGVCCRNFHCPYLLKLLHLLISAGKDIHIIHIENCGVTEGLDYLAHAIKFNADLEISYWNLSYNNFIDFQQFIMIINFSKGNLLYLNLNYCNISTVDSSELFTALWRNSMMHNLKYLYIAGMNFLNEKGEVQINSFEKYISRNCNIEILDISSIQSEAASEILSVFSEKQNKIKKLLVKNVDFSSSKKTCFERLLSFLMKTNSLETLDISNTKLSPHQVETVISTISKNFSSRKKNDLFDLNLGNMNLNGKNILILYRAFLDTDMSIWGSLRLDENEMNVNDLKNLVPLLTRMKNLNTLSISGNFDSNMIEIEFVLPLVLKIPCLTALYISGNKDHKLRNKISVLLDKVYKTDKLSLLDISENASFEALNGISHILHSCQNMKQFFFDGNELSSIDQFESLTSAISENKTVISAPFPINDFQSFIKSCTIERAKEKLKEEDQIKIESKNEEDEDPKKKNKKNKKDKKKDKKKKKSKENDKKSIEKVEIDIESKLREKEKEAFNEQNIKDFIKILSELQVTAITAVNANRINQKLPNDLPFPATVEIENLIQSISHQTRISIKNKNLKNHSCIAELLNLSLPFQNEGDVVRNGGNVRTISIGQLKRYRIESMESVVENKKPIDKMSTMVLPTTMMLHFNTQFLNNESEQSSSDSDSESSAESSDTQDEDGSESPKGNKKRKKAKLQDSSEGQDEDDSYRKKRKKKPRQQESSDDGDEDESYRNAKKKKPRQQESSDDDDEDESYRNAKKKKPRQQESSDDDDEDESYRNAKKKKPRQQESSDDQDGSYRKRKKKAKNNGSSDDQDEDDSYRKRKKKPRQQESSDDESDGSAGLAGKRRNNRVARGKGRSESLSSDEGRPKKRRVKPPNRRRNESTESETDSDPLTESSSSSRPARRRAKPAKKAPASSESDGEYSVRRKRVQKPSKRYQSSESESESEADEEEDEMKPWKNRLRTKHGSDNGLDKLVDTSYKEMRPKRKANGRGASGYAAGYFDEETLDSIDMKRKGRNNRNDQNNMKSKKKPNVTFNLS
ncbi:barbed-end actin filament uncapping [Tritrichomonas musculus]|uniref:Barbed-end actin filament uncapping n=1 Tax=Tritrichomonas musculus TaxID=1915356 RepID=A0ABR2I6S6_9EUKA